jgi:hypothetical protein
MCDHARELCVFLSKDESRSALLCAMMRRSLVCSHMTHDT